MKTLSWKQYVQQSKNLSSGNKSEKVVQMVKYSIDVGKFSHLWLYTLLKLFIEEKIHWDTDLNFKRY